MLTLPPTPSPLNTATAYRAVSAVEPARPIQAVGALEPAPAITKERSKAENPVQPGVVLSAGLSALIEKKRPTAGLSPSSDTSNRSVSNTEDAPAAPLLGQTSVSPPPAEKTHIQKALETQMKGLLSNIWKASAKAVDFLLQRSSVGDETTAQLVATQAGNPQSQKSVNSTTSGKTTTAQRTSANDDDTSAGYTSEGTPSNGPTAGRGRLLNLSA